MACQNRRMAETWLFLHDRAAVFVEMDLTRKPPAPTPHPPYYGMSDVGLRWPG